MMKRSLLAIILSFALAIPTTAGELSFSGSSTEVAVHYHAESQYCVMIPEVVEVGGSYTLQASMMDLCEGEQVAVTIGNIADDGTFVMHAGDRQMTARVVTNGGGVTAPGATIATFVNGQMESPDGFYLESIQVDGAGDYYGSITFGINLIGGAV